MNTPRIGWHDKYYWSGRYWYIAESVSVLTGRGYKLKTLVGAGATRVEAFKDLKKIKNGYKKNPA